MNVTFEDVKNSPEIRTYITQADASLTALGYTEHSFPHVGRCAQVAARIATRASTLLLNRMTGAVLTVLGVVLIVINYC